jgi:23S rRNA (cytosine1962-C5)-methyltransferase
MMTTIAEAVFMSDTVHAAQLPVLRLKRNEDRRLHAGHLWIFSNEIDTQQTPLPKFKAGELVRVLAHNDRALGLGYVNPHSLIAARLLSSWTIPDTAWIKTRIARALKLRERLYAKPYYRLVYGESDGLPGLVVDRYGPACVVQIGTAGMERLKTPIQEALLQLLQCEWLLYKNDGSARELEGLPAYVEVAKGSFDGPGTVLEDDMTFQAPLLEGQKTGWFFDQAYNRRALVQFLQKGARVLDVFSYVGAWGVRAARHGAEVTLVDSSAAALAMAEANAARNGVRLLTKQGDAFQVLEEMKAQGARFDVVIVDPPAFAKRKKDHPKALAAYKRLNQLAISLLTDDGILVSCSCSYHISAEDLQDAIAKAARGADKQLQILQAGGQAPDHPVHPAIPETRYLKSYFCRVNDGLK